VNWKCRFKAILAIFRKKTVRGTLIVFPANVETQQMVDCSVRQLLETGFRQRDESHLPIPCAPLHIHPQVYLITETGPT
jgi:hypothetical protein